LRLRRPPQVHLDTCHFRGNFPESAQVEVASVPEGTAFDPAAATWSPLLARTKMSADAIHAFSANKGELVVCDEAKGGAFSHLRVTIFPDGGIMRVRAFGKPSAL